MRVWRCTATSDSPSTFPTARGEPHTAVPDAFAYRPRPDRHYSFHNSDLDDHSELTRNGISLAQLLARNCTRLIDVRYDHL
jgi:hypothetical protein